MRKIDHINIRVPDMEEGVKYYTEVMGFKETARFNGNLKFVFMTDGVITYELIEDTTLEAIKFEHIAYESQDINAEYKHFEKLGLTITELGFIPYLFDDGMYYFFIKGANGERIEFCQKV